MIVTRLLYKKLIKIATICLWTIGMAGMCALGSIEINYMHTMPRAPQPQVERTYQWNAHGAIVYITRDQYVILYRLRGLFILSFIATAILNIIFRGVWDNDPESHRGGG